MFEQCKVVCADVVFQCPNFQLQLYPANLEIVDHMHQAQHHVVVKTLMMHQAQAGNFHIFSTHVCTHEYL